MVRSPTKNAAFKPSAGSFPEPTCGTGMYKLTFKLNPKHPVIRVAAAVILVASVVAAIGILVASVLFTIGLTLVSLVLHPTLIKLGRRGMWRLKPNGKTVLALDAEAFRKA